MKINIFLIGALTLDSVLAAGKGGHGSIKDLGWPLFNFLILMLPIFLKRKSISEAFTSWSKEVEENIQSASKKSQEAKLKLQDLEQKLKDADGEERKILGEAENQFDDFAKRSKKELEEKINRIKKDATTRAETERSQLVKKLNEDLVNEVIAKAKEAVSSDGANRSRATKKLLSQVK